MRELQGQPVEQETELRIDLPVKAFVPPGWLAQESLRLELYRRIGMARDHEALAMIRDETVDRFGALPEPVQVLFAIASLRLTALALERRGDHHLSRAGPCQAARAVRRVELGLSAVSPARRTRTPRGH